MPNVESERTGLSLNEGRVSIVASGGLRPAAQVQEAGAKGAFSGRAGQTSGSHLSSSYKPDLKAACLWAQVPQDPLTSGEKVIPTWYSWARGQSSRLDSES